jgi:predicted aldo/keto reductase-like oxidoreductase
LGGVAALGAVLPPAGSAADEVDEPRVRSYRRLGRTGLEISDISFGASRNSDPDLVRYALDRGINYFDTAEGYQGGASEKAIGLALQGERRERAILVSKTHADAGGSEADFMSALEGSLQRLRTDRVDIYMNHAVNHLSRVRNDAWYRFIERAKQQGKIRFSGVSGHGGRLAGCLDHVLDQDLIDVMLVAHNFGQDESLLDTLKRPFDFVSLQPELPRLIRKAHAKGVGVVAMKTLMGARLNDMRPFEREGGTFSHAAFRWVLSNSDVDALVVSMRSRSQLDEYLGASGSGPVRQSDRELLRRYVELQSPNYCRPGCDACAGACPHGVEISEVLRSRMYATDYGDLAQGQEAYATLGPGAAACLGCSATPCLGACPYELPVANLTREAHELLV